MIDIFIPGEPDRTTAQEKGVTVKRSRTGKFYVHFYHKPEVKRAINKLMNQIYPYKPEEPFEGPVAVSIMWCFGRGSKSKKYIGRFKDTKPDLDNLSKNLLDIMTKLNFWKDDGQVSVLILRKYWVEDERAGIKITIDDSLET